LGAEDGRWLMGDRLLRGSGGGEAAIDILTLELMELMLKVRTIYVSADGVLPYKSAMCFETGEARLKAHRRLVWCNSIFNFSDRAYSSHDGIRVSALG
jgi:hypothetical protein